MNLVTFDAQLDDLALQGRQLLERFLGDEPQERQRSLTVRVFFGQRIRVESVALAKEVRAYAESLAAKPFKPLAEVKARINAIARTGIPEVNAMTEGFLDRG